MTVTAPETLVAVRELERALDLAVDADALAERRLRDATAAAADIVAAARERGAELAATERREVLAAAERDCAAAQAAAEAQITALLDLVEAHRAHLLAAYRAVVMPVPRPEVER